MATKMGETYDELVEVTGVKELVSPEEWETRVNLAACYRMVWEYGWHHLNLNHISARVPGEEEHVLLNPYGPMYNEVTASNLVKVDLDGNVLDENTPYHINQAGYTIHSAVHAARPDAKCVLHTHTPAGIAVSTLKCGLLPLHQEALRFYGGIGYHDYEGVSLELDERERLVKSLGDNKVLILRNHGLLTCGRTISEAFVLMYHLERSCEAQIMAGATTEDDNVHILPSEAVRQNAAEQTNLNGRNAGELRWPALMRWMDRIDPSFRN